MKKLILILTIIFACSLCVCAHPGSLDENGGHWEQRQAAKVKPKPIYNSLPVVRPTVDDDEAQRLDSLLLYVDELEKSRTKYKNNKKK